MYTVYRANRARYRTMQRRRRRRRQWTRRKAGQRARGIDSPHLEFAVPPIVRPQNLANARTHARVAVTRSYRSSRGSRFVRFAGERLEPRPKRSWLLVVGRMRALRRSPRECASSGAGPHVPAPPRHFNRRRSANRDEPPVTSVVSYQLTVNGRADAARAALSAVTCVAGETFKSARSPARSLRPTAFRRVAGNATSATGNGKWGRRIVVCLRGKTRENDEMVARGKWARGKRENLAYVTGKQCSRWLHLAFGMEGSLWGVRYERAIYLPLRFVSKVGNIYAIIIA